MQSMIDWETEQRYLQIFTEYYSIHKAYDMIKRDWQNACWSHETDKAICYHQAVKALEDKMAAIQKQGREFGKANGLKFFKQRQLQAQAKERIYIG